MNRGLGLRRFLVSCWRHVGRILAPLGHPVGIKIASLCVPGVQSGIMASSNGPRAMFLDTVLRDPCKFTWIPKPMLRQPRFLQCCGPTALVIHVDSHGCVSGWSHITQFYMEP